VASAPTRDRAARRRRPDIERANEVAISATLTTIPGETELARLSGLARYAEVRADIGGEMDPRYLREHFEGGLAYTLRSRERGGAEDLSPAERGRRLARAAARFDLVDLEHPGDLTPELLARVPPERRRISWHGPPARVEDLAARFEQMAAVPARLYLLAPQAIEPVAALAPLQLLRSLRRTDVTAFATGPAGTWTRLLAPRLGALVAYGRLAEEDASGVPGVHRLSADFGMPAMPRLRDLYGIVGGSVAGSLAPRIYNRGFRALGLPALCLPFSTDDFAGFWRGLVQTGLPGLGAPVRGLTVVTPHKEEALEVAALTTVRARESGAANSLVRAGQAWHGATTTRLGRPLALADVPVAGRRIAVVGCGGAGRTGRRALPASR
jgi:3-dehydroquinate dehydratase / shikimate dehydrogenase